MTWTCQKCGKHYKSINDKLTTVETLFGHDVVPTDFAENSTEEVQAWKCPACKHRHKIHGYNSDDNNNQMATGSVTSAILLANTAKTLKQSQKPGTNTMAKAVDTFAKHWLTDT